jgi:hypothetical protein
MVDNACAGDLVPETETIPGFDVFRREYRFQSKRSLF